MPEAAVGIADLVTGGRVGRALETYLAFKPAEAKRLLDAYYSEGQQAAFARVQEAEGVLEKAAAALANPSVVAHTVIESAPSMLGGAGVARGLLRAAPRLSPVVAGAAGEGAVAAGQAAEAIRETSADGTLAPSQAALAATSGAATGALGAFGGRLADRLGIGDVETMLAAASTTVAARKGLARRVLEGAVAEGVLEELPQSVQEQVLQNAATGRDLTDGVDDAIVLGTLAGATMGGAAQLVTRRRGTSPPPGAPGSTTGHLRPEGPPRILEAVPAATGGDAPRILEAVPIDAAPSPAAESTPAVAVPATEERPQPEYTPEAPPVLEAVPIAETAVPPTTADTLDPPETGETIETPDAPDTDLFGQPLPAEPSIADLERGGFAVNPEDPQPGDYAILTPDRIVADPERFQFKQGANREGVTAEDRIPGPWNENRAGLLLVWHDPADGQTYVINGHHRLEAGQRLGADRFAVRYISAPDANAAMLEGALTNIAEKRGTPVDVAKVVRNAGLDRERLRGAGVNPESALARDGLALARLSDPLFVRVATGELPVAHGAVIGAAGLSPEGQDAVVRLWERQQAKGRTLTPAQLGALVEDVAGSAEVAAGDADGQGNIFTDILGEERVENTAVEKAILKDHVRRELAKDKRLFGFVAKGTRAQELARAGNVIDVAQSQAVASGAAAVGDAFDRLASVTGPVADALNDAARAIVSGEKPDAVRPRLLDAIRAAVEAELRGPARSGQARSAQAGAAGAARSDHRVRPPEPATGPAGAEARPDAVADAAPRREYSSTQVDLPDTVAAPMRAMAARIPDADLAEDGRETEAHITIQYGLDTDDVEPLRAVLAQQAPITVTLGKTSLFENDDADVVKIDVDSPDLNRVRAAIRRALDAPGDTHPTYSPHATIAYVKPGRGAAYAGDTTLEGQQVTLDRLTFSTRDGQRIEIPLGGQAASAPAESAPQTATAENIAAALNIPLEQAQAIRALLEATLLERADDVQIVRGGEPGADALADDPRRAAAQRLWQRIAASPLLTVSTEPWMSGPRREVLPKALTEARRRGTETVTNRDTGVAIIVAPSGVKNALEHGTGPHKVALSRHINALVEQAAFVASEAPTSANPGVSAIETYAGRARVDGRDFVVRLVIRVTADGRRFYDHHLTSLTPGREAGKGRGSSVPLGASQAPDLLGRTFRQPYTTSLAKRLLDDALAVKDDPSAPLYQSDRLPTGEEQPRLPGEVGDVRDEDRPTPREALPEQEFRLTAPTMKPRRPKQSVLFQLDGETLFELVDDTSVNASGESAASAEAISRLRGMKARGETFALRTRGGQVRPLIGPDAVDVTPGPNQDFGILRADGSFQVLDRGTRRLYQAAWHGSPHLFDEFSLHEIGTGEGAQAYGWGLYFAGDKAVAEYYRKNLSRGPVITVDGQSVHDLDSFFGAHVRNIVNDVTGGSAWAPAKKAALDDLRWRRDHARTTISKPTTSASFRADLEEEIAGIEDAIARIEPLDQSSVSTTAGGRLYKVEIPEDEDFLDWDKPLSEQSEKVRAAIDSFDLGLRDMAAAITGVLDPTGASIYRVLQDQYGRHGHPNTAKAASEELAAAGLAGIRYLDGSSRSKGEGTHNYVVFDDKLVKILEFEQRTGATAKGSVEFLKAEAEALIRGFAASDVSTGVHELAHVARRWLFDRTIPVDRRRGISDEDITTTEQWAGAKDGQWDTAAEEKFARGFERFLRERMAPADSKLRSIFEKMAAWLTDIYQTVAGSPIDVEISPEMRGVFERLVTRQERLEGTTAPTDAARLRELTARYAPGNPFAARAARARLKADRLNRPTPQERAMADAFPLGAGRGGAPRPGAARRIDASVTRAAAAVQATKDAEHLEAKAAAFDKGRINAQGRATNPAARARAEKREASAERRQARIDAAKQALEGQQPWEVAPDVFADARGSLAGSGRALVLNDHREHVERALAEGKTVPAAVLAAYPDLAPRGRRAPAGNATVEADFTDFPVETGTVPRPGRTLLDEDDVPPAALAPSGTRAVTATRPVEFPELVALARELAQVPEVVKRFRGGARLGDFTGIGRGRIRLAAHLFQRTAALKIDAPIGTAVINPKTQAKYTVAGHNAEGHAILAPVDGGTPFTVTPDHILKGVFRQDVSEANLQQLAKTLAHEIGHLVDWLPDQTLKRGNLLGRLRSLHEFLKGTFTTQGGEIIANADIRRELVDVSKAWRGDFNEKGGSSYDRYRQRGRELYADAISALLNNPGWLQRTAPTFYAQFFDHLDAKPEVRSAYFGLQELLSGTREELIARRRAGVREMFEEGDAKAIEVERLRQRERQLSARDLWLRFRIQHVDKNTPLIDRVRALQDRGVHVPEDEDPRYLLEERSYLGGQIKAFVETHLQPVYASLQQVGVDWHTFGEQLFYDRIVAGDRSEVANPRGLTVEAAQELRTALRAGLSPAQQTTLDAAATRWRAAVKRVAETAYQAGLYRPELYQQMQENPAYATYRVIDYIERDVTSSVHRQVGTLKDIQNVADATALKMLVTLRAAEYNRMKVATFRFLEQHFPQDIAQAEQRWNGRGIVPVEARDPKRQVLVTYKEAGRLRGKYVDPYVADSLNNASVGHAWAVVTALRWVNNRLFRPVFTTYNPGFQTFNVARDFMRFWKNMPGMTFRRALQRYRQAAPLARARAFGVGPAPTAAARQGYADLLAAEDARILSTTFNDLMAGRDPEETQIEDILAKAGIGQYQTPADRPRVLRPLIAVLDWIKATGDFVETLPKAAAIYEFTDGTRSIADLTPAERSFIRRKVGSPDFLAGGTFKPITNELLLFSNAITQAVRSDLEVARDPQTASGFWYKTVAVNVVPKLALFAALYLAEAAGGDDEEDEAFALTAPATWTWPAIRRALEGVSEYDLTNYLPIPLGVDAGGKTIYVRLPQDDLGRLVGGLTWKLLQGARGDREATRAAYDVLSYMSGQAPGVTPTLTTAREVGQYVTGQNVYDAFRGRFLFTEDELAADDGRKVRKFLGYEFQQLGGGILWRFAPGEARPPREQSTVQKVIEFPFLVPNLVGRWIRVSDVGHAEKLRETRQGVQREEARARLTERAAVTAALQRYRQLAPPQQTEAQQRRLAREIVRELYPDARPAERARQLGDVLRKIRMGVARGGADPITDALLGATSTAQRVAIIQRAQRELAPPAFAAWYRRAQQTGVVSAEVTTAVRRARQEARPE